MGGLAEAQVQAEGTLDGGRRNRRLAEAVHRYGAVSRKGLEERFFTLAFSGLVYPQIWEDPVVDLEAMALKPGQRVAAIASGGCNVLSYVTAADVRVTALDLNPAHVALNNLKVAAVRHCPDYETFARFFASANDRETADLYDRLLAPHLDRATRAYWEGRDMLGRRRIGYFGRHFYRQGLLGWFITMGHAHRAPARAQSGADARSEEPRRPEADFRRRTRAAVRDAPHALADGQAGVAVRSRHPAIAVRCAEGTRAAYGRRAQGAARPAWRTGSISPTTISRGRPSVADMRLMALGLCRLISRAENWKTLKERADRVTVVHASFDEHLSHFQGPAYDAYVLLDAQDWMTDTQLTALWSEIVRTAMPGARVIFRTAGEDTILPGRVPDTILGRFRYDADYGRGMVDKDRSSIYGGFHLYTFEG